MKEFHYILFSIFLSSMIIYMGVGIPIVQSRCYQCADKDAALLTVVDISNYGCTCGCGDVGNKNVKSGSGCSCHHDKMMERKSSDVLPVPVRGRYGWISMLLWLFLPISDIR